MNAQHKELAGWRWRQLPFVEQMANIGSEVERSLNWKNKNDAGRLKSAFERSLELIDLTLEDARNNARLKELARMREAIVGYFTGDNQSGSTDASWRKYFMCFTYAARRDR